MDIKGSRIKLDKNPAPIKPAKPLAEPHPRCFFGKFNNEHFKPQTKLKSRKPKKKTVIIERYVFKIQI